MRWVWANQKKEKQQERFYTCLWMEISERGWRCIRNEKQANNFIGCAMQRQSKQKRNECERSFKKQISKKYSDSYTCTNALHPIQILYCWATPLHTHRYSEQNQTTSYAMCECFPSSLALSFFFWIAIIGHYWCENCQYLHFQCDLLHISSMKIYTLFGC